MISGGREMAYGNKWVKKSFYLEPKLFCSKTLIFWLKNLFKNNQQHSTNNHRIIHTLVTAFQNSDLGLLPATVKNGALLATPPSMI